MKRPTQKKMKKKPIIKKMKKKTILKKDCDYGLENIDNNFPKIKQFERKPRK